jgi:diguanylate cyclase (GGDEF)-like protein
MNQDSPAAAAAPQPMDTDQQAPGFRSIRNRILLFSILVTLLPSLGMGWLWFDVSRQATTDKTAQKLADSAGIAEREINLWLKERQYDLRVFANSSIIRDNLLRIRAVAGNTGKTAEQTRQESLGNIAGYLNLIQGQFEVYQCFVVLDPQGKVLVASDSSDDGPHPDISGDWQVRAESSSYFFGEVSFTGNNGVPVLPLGLPLFLGAGGDHHGFLVMEAGLQELLPLLKTSLPLREGSGELIALLARAGDKVIVTAGGQVAGSGPAGMTPPIRSLRDAPRQLREFSGEGGLRLVGILHPLSEVPWDLVLAENADVVFAGLIRERNRILLITILLTIAIGGSATIVASRIILPLQALTDGVLRVAGGDLEARVHVRRQDELGIVSTMFNEMVQRLKEGQVKLEQMATTDPLTGLANRKQIMTDLEIHLEQHHRYGSDFSLLMVDIDHFKRINDTHGHQTGDAVLVQMARIFRETLRSLDSAGRYGGEEFLILLGQIDAEHAKQTAERIRSSVARHVFVIGDVSLQVTVSIGVGGLKEESDSSSEIIGRADRALYAAKAGGRNRVEVE